ncbi:hypothetical protein DICPUDRAFT_77119 [Dictyostelium purpureum]|uniref:Uncharacterized protein n=1 Tax=Dictyostelium purpureum TaxID=5786 RepID=F0ZFN2_DICPU|nr:uncharacterized protein DICPUDRAFT_77119 [Dictyostelium purpureum]EGC37262.1 hypothetical protein DICPUDRAFT_77119 [Dictyostelium purpureum]|eukprot:XP_003286232.1 hypothetical protein DICPUDRAFT_77119 [Dictyostelium purpureum]
MSADTTFIQTFDLNKLNEEVTKKLDENPLQTIAPIGFTGKSEDKNDLYNPVVDALDINVATLYTPISDLELSVSSVIGCIPEVGALCQGFFSVFMSRTKEETLTKDVVEKIINEKIAKFKVELEHIIDQKISKSEAEQYKTICDKAFKGLCNSSLELLIDDLNILKKKLLLKEKVNPTDGFMVGLRGKYKLIK